ncbi:hypothetical protein [Microbulbifer sp. JMSA002]|uniref:hypothetical protein n=1 Tax=Microbulbifer sp. JMSA002 TaxID=3243368 RepID=UPI00403A59BA
MSAFNRHIDMLKLVARALGPELRRQMTFVGGCTTGLLLTDAYTQEQVRHTDDVDLIVHVMGYVGFHHLQEQLRGQGFKQYSAASDEDFPVCAMRLGDLRVDFMPDDETILGFGNRWYRDAVETATTYALSDELDINLINPVYFIATKLEAYKGRGNSDPMSSRDIEDILNLIDGREELQAEVEAAEKGVRHYIVTEVAKLLEHSDLPYAIQSQAEGSTEREELLFQRLEQLAVLSATH